MLELTGAPGKPWPGSNSVQAQLGLMAVLRLCLQVSHSESLSHPPGLSPPPLHPMDLRGGDSRGCGVQLGPPTLICVPHPWERTRSQPWVQQPGPGSAALHEPWQARIGVFSAPPALLWLRNQPRPSHPPWGHLAPPSVPAGPPQLLSPAVPSVLPLPARHGRSAVGPHSALARPWVAQGWHRVPVAAWGPLGWSQSSWGG